MTPDTAVDALRRNRADASTAKQQAVLAALDRLCAAGHEVNISTVARAAGVSRQFLYTHEALRQAVASATPTGSKGQHDEDTGAHMSRGLRADRRILTAKVERQAAAITDLKEQIATLEHQRQRWLGTQLNADPSIDPEAHSELRITNERLTAQNASLTAQVTELRRINTILEADLAASRQAHAEDVANLLPDTAASVTTMASRR